MLDRENKKKDPVETTVSTLRNFVTNDLLYASDIGDIAADDELLGSGMLDSLASAQLMVFIEETYAIKLDPGDLTFENFNTLNALSAMVARHTNQ
jgi:acyl carrier protein